MVDLTKAIQGAGRKITSLP